MANEAPNVKVKQVQQFLKGDGHSADRTPLALKLHILHVLFASELAGSERYCIDLANGQAALGHEVHLVVPRGLPVAELLNRQVSAAHAPATIDCHGRDRRRSRSFELGLQGLCNCS
jgi:hypothetical protein